MHFFNIDTPKNPICVFLTPSVFSSCSLEQFHAKMSSNCIRKISLHALMDLVSLLEKMFYYQSAFYIIRLKRERKEYA
jgi:hypothetical protein